MVVSVKTASDILEIVLKYVPEEHRDALVNDLKRVDGNQSRRDTVARIEQLMRMNNG